MTFPIFTKLGAAVIVNAVDVSKTDLRKWLLETETALNALFAPYPLFNGTIVESHTGNAVTFALKTLAGANPSAADPVYVSFLTTAGAYVIRAVTAALSITLAAGSTLGQSNGIPFQVAVGAIDNAGTVEMWAAGRLVQQGAGLYLDEAALVTTIAEGAGAADSAGVLYTATARSSKAVRALARADYDSGLATAGTWGVSPTRTVLQIPGMARAGLPAAFYVYKSATQTGIVTNTYTKVSFNTERSDVGGFFDAATNSRWTPPPGLVHLSGMIWASAGAKNSGSAQYVAKIIKNGSVDVAAGQGQVNSAFPTTAACQVNAYDIANGADYYELWFYGTTDTTLTLDNNPAHTWFTGAVIGGV